MLLAILQLQLFGKRLLKKMLFLNKIAIYKRSYQLNSLYVYSLPLAIFTQSRLMNNFYESLNKVLESKSSNNQFNAWCFFGKSMIFNWQLEAESLIAYFTGVEINYAWSLEQSQKRYFKIGSGIICKGICNIGNLVMSPIDDVISSTGNPWNKQQKNSVHSLFQMNSLKVTIIKEVI